MKNTRPLEFVIGSAEHFVVFDVEVFGPRARLQAVQKTTAGKYTPGHQSQIVCKREVAHVTALGMVHAALNWCAEHQVEHDEEYWSQDPMKFFRAVILAVRGDLADKYSPITGEYR